MMIMLGGKVRCNSAAKITPLHDPGRQATSSKHHFSNYFLDHPCKGCKRVQLLWPTGPTRPTDL